MRRSEEVWEGELDVDAVAIPEGESGGRKERLTAERLDRIATYYAAPEAVRAVWGGPKDLAQLARDVGCRVRSLHLWQKHPKMVSRVREIVELSALYAMPNIIYGQMILATPDIRQKDDGSYTVVPGDTKASNFVATVAKFIRANQLNVNQTNLNQAPEAPRMSDEEFMEQYVKAGAQIERIMASQEGSDEDDEA